MYVYHGVCVCVFVACLICGMCVCVCVCMYVCVCVRARACAYMCACAGMCHSPLPSPRRPVTAGGGGQRSAGGVGSPHRPSPNKHLQGDHCLGHFRLPSHTVSYVGFFFCFFVFLFFAFPSYISGRSPLLGEIFAYVTVF